MSPVRRRLALALVIGVVLLAGGRGVGWTGHAQELEPACAPRIERQAAWRTVSVRGLDEPCTLSIAALAALVERDLTSLPAGELDSLFLGRLVDYPELSALLLETVAVDPAWQRDRPPPPGEANALAAAALARALVETGAFAPLREALAARGLEIAGASCEKVLAVTDHPSTPEWARGKLGLPYDALCWIRVRAR